MWWSHEFWTSLLSLRRICSFSYLSWINWTFPTLTIDSSVVMLCGDSRRDSRLNLFYRGCKTCLLHATRVCVCVLQVIGTESRYSSYSWDSPSLAGLLRAACRTNTVTHTQVQELWSRAEIWWYKQTELSNFTSQRRRFLVVLIFTTDIFILWRRIWTATYGHKNVPYMDITNIHQKEEEETGELSDLGPGS